MVFYCELDCFKEKPLVPNSAAELLYLAGLSAIAGIRGAFVDSESSSTSHQVAILMAIHSATLPITSSPHF